MLILKHETAIASFVTEGSMTETRIALMGIIVDEASSTQKLNAVLHEYNNYVVGRMGIPYRQKEIAIISVVVDAPQDIISSLSGKLGMIPGISIKTVYSKTPPIRDAV